MIPQSTVCLIRLESVTSQTLLHFEHFAVHRIVFNLFCFKFPEYLCRIFLYHKELFCYIWTVGFRSSGCGSSYDISSFKNRTRIFRFAKNVSFFCIKCWSHFCCRDIFFAANIGRQFSLHDDCRLATSFLLSSELKRL